MPACENIIFRMWLCYMHEKILIFTKHLGVGDFCTRLWKYILTILKDNFCKCNSVTVGIASVLPSSSRSRMYRKQLPGFHGVLTCTWTWSPPYAVVSRSDVWQVSSPPCPWYVTVVSVTMWSFESVCLTSSVSNRLYWWNFVVTNFVDTEKVVDIVKFCSHKLREIPSCEQVCVLCSFVLAGGVGVIDRMEKDMILFSFGSTRFSLLATTLFIFFYLTITSTFVVQKVATSNLMHYCKQNLTPAKQYNGASLRRTNPSKH